MNFRLIHLFSFIFFTVTYSQNFDTYSIASGEVDYAKVALPADIDGDGD
tara:strand:- start:375 stop:521 length:147 start_codon:yes stop_codon:yes gene_type:complete